MIGFVQGRGKYVSVAATYGGSVAVLLVGEVLLARASQPVEFGSYQLVRQAVPVVVALSLLSYDQVLAREIASGGMPTPPIGPQQRRLIYSSAFVATLFAIYSNQVLNLPAEIAATLVLASAAVALTSLISGVMRAEGQYLAAAVSAQGHRLVLGLCLVVGASWLSGFSAAVSFTASAVVIAVYAALWMWRRRAVLVLDGRAHKRLRRLGYGVSVSAVTLAATDWLDTALVAGLSGSLSEAGQYGAAKLVGTYPLLSVGSILGFVALTEVARAGRQASLDATRRMTILSVAAACATALWLLVAIVSVPILYGGDVSKATLVALVLTGGLRLFYVLPSSVVGAFAGNRHLNLLGLACMLGLLMQGLVTWALHLHVSIDVAASIGLLANTTIRVCVSARLATILLTQVVAPAKRET